LLPETKQALTMTQPGLFDALPEFPVALPDDELQLLARLPEWPTSTEVDDEEQAACRRLEKRGLVKLHRWKDDPMAIRSTWYAGKLPTAALRHADAEIVET
jgi:hypothetical protein